MTSDKPAAGPVAAPKKGCEDKKKPPAGVSPPQVEVGGRNGPDPTRYGDWEINGKCVDF